MEVYNAIEILSTQKKYIKEFLFTKNNARKNKYNSEIPRKTDTLQIRINRVKCA